MAVAEVLLGIDVGTTFCKAAVVDLEGRERAHARVRTPWKMVPTGAEIDPYHFVSACAEAAGQALSEVREAVAGVGVTSMAETGVLLNAGGEPVAPSIAWHDSRGQQESAELAAELGVEDFTTTTGLRVSTMPTLVKYVWMRRRLDEAARGARWLNVAEWVVSRWGGDHVAELSLASRTGFLDVHARRWWDSALAWAEAPPGLMPEPRESASPAGMAVAPDGARGAVLTVAGHDHSCASVGAGATRPGDVFDSCGSAESFVRAVVAEPSRAHFLEAAGGGVSIGRHVLPEAFALMGGFSSGLALRRFLDLLGARGEDAIQALDDQARITESAGLEVDGIDSERACLSGIDRGVTPARVWRAAIEAVQRRGASVLKTIESIAGPTERLVVTGGSARSPAVLDVKRAVLGPFVRPAVEEAGARGAALMAGVAAGIYPSLYEAPEAGILSEA